MSKITEPADPINKEKFQEIKATTWLSPRETEIYLLKKNGKTTDEISEILELKKETVYDYWANAKDKVKKSRRTTDLNIG